MQAATINREKLAASYYRVFIDSVKLFFVNVFLYVLFLEGYVMIFMIQRRFSIDLPFAEAFFTWVATFMILVVWIAMASLLHRRTLPLPRLFIRTLIAELPFILLLCILWLRAPYNYYEPTINNLLLVFTGYMLLFPLVITIAYRHSQAMVKNKKT